MMMIKYIYTPLFIIFCAAQFSFAQSLPPTQVMLKSASFTKSEYKAFQKGTAGKDIQNFVRDTLQFDNAEIYLGSDGTFNYPVVIQVHLSNGEVNILNLPFTNLVVGREMEYIKNSFRLSEDKKSWTFKVKLSADGVGYYRSEALVVPSKEQNNMTYTFTSTDQGKTWVIALEIFD